ncbi:uncharacterized protein DNG_01931 [Cephalotrichum gorgonifer]|uniref:Altered inheritance of mitochondria protein 6 n=1 Tax=Cephalotrichum gorgonifer TaxID=2041049 RepID=A0AAE8SS31_9PEZI|nr:uncharacterized protein DNG_01931 [Cephalotrichum gorgonifer]
MESASTSSRRSSSESTICNDMHAQTGDIEHAQPLLRPSTSDSARYEKGARQSASTTNRRATSTHDGDDALIVKGVRVGREAVLCGVLLTTVTMLLLFLGIPTVLARLLYRDSPYTARPDPIPCHSHNDYWRKEPLFSALKTGCIGIEADVWLVEDDLWIAHEESDLKRGVTFTRLYVDPLVELLEQRNAFSPAQGWSTLGVYESDPDQTVVLMIDLKSESHDTWPVVLDQLQALRDRGWLTHVGEDGHVHRRPVTVVGSGTSDFSTLAANSTYRDAFFDAPLDDLEGSPYDATNSYYASVSFRKHLGFAPSGHLSGDQLAKLRRAVAEAHSRGLKARYWGSPAWALNVRDRMWRTLSDEGVDLVNVDDLQSFRDWTTRRRLEQAGGR